MQIRKGKCPEKVDGDTLSRAEPVQTTPNSPTGGRARGKRALSRCKTSPEKALLVVKGRLNGPMQMKMTVVVQAGDD